LFVQGCGVPGGRTLLADRMIQGLTRDCDNHCERNWQGWWRMVVRQRVAASAHSVCVIRRSPAWLAGAV
jgi:hypothetical protein